MEHQKPHAKESPSDQDTTLTRRQMLLGIAAGAVAATVGGVLNSGCASATAPQPVPQPPPLAEGRIQRVIAPSVQPFALTDVRLLDGPFLQAQQRDAKYLLSLEPDRM